MTTLNHQETLFFLTVLSGNTEMATIEGGNKRGQLYKFRSKLIEYWHTNLVAPAVKSGFTEKLATSMITLTTVPWAQHSHSPAVYPFDCAIAQTNTITVGYGLSWYFPSATATKQINFVNAVNLSKNNLYNSALQPFPINKPEIHPIYLNDLGQHKWSFYRPRRT